MSLLELFFPVATVVLAAGCFVCWKTNKPLREKAREEREAIAKKEADEVIRLAREADDAKIAEAVVKALKVLFDEARDYSVRGEEDRRNSRHSYGYQPPVFNRETREVFHKVLRVGALEIRMDNQEEGNKVRRKAINDVSQQVHEIRKVIDMYV